MKTLVTENEVKFTACQNSIRLAVDDVNGLIIVKSMKGELDLGMRVEINTNDSSISVLNHSDLGVVVDNEGLVTIHRAKIEGELIMQNPDTGNWFSFRPDATGNLVGTPV